MPYSHRRSLEKEQEHRKRHRRHIIEHRIFWDCSQHDNLNGEIAHTVPTEKIVYEQIKLVFGDNNSFICGGYEYGEVLNRFNPWSVFQQRMKLARSFQA